MNDWNSKSGNKMNSHFNVRSSLPKGIRNQNVTPKSNAAAVKSLLSGQRNMLQENGAIEQKNNLEKHVMLDLPDNLMAGDKLYALVDGLPYEIIVGDNNEYVATPATSIDISQLEGLQSTNNIDYNKSGELQKENGLDASQMLLSGSAENVAHQQGSELVFQSNMLPPEIQEMVAKGQIDLSNYEFVIQDDVTGTQQQVFLSDGSGQYDAAILQQLLQQQQDAEVSLPDSIGTTSNTYDVLSMLADASTQQESLLNVSEIVSRVVSTETACDDEFLYVMVSEDGDNSTVAALNDVPLQLNDGYSTSFDRFIKGLKLETLSAVTSSAIFNRPVLPMYDPALCRPSTTNRANTQSFAQKLGSGNSVGRPPGSRLNASSFRPLSTAVGMGRIIKRKTRGSDEDSFDNSDAESGGSDPGWKPSLEYETPVRKVTFPPTRPISRGRGRGRPRGSGRGMSSNVVHQPPPATTTHAPLVRKVIAATPTPAPNKTSTIVATNSIDCHNYQKGDFVLERKDGNKTEAFPLWRIEAGRLLQKYDFIQDSGPLCHKSASVYSSWSGDIKTNFKSVLVDVLTPNVKRQEIVQLKSQYRNKPYDESLETHPLIELFNIYVQNMVSQALDSTFMAAIFQQQEEYYLGPLRQINMLLEEAEKTIMSEISWQRLFKDVVNNSPFYRIQDAPITSRDAFICQATNKTCQSTKLLTLFGPMYDVNMLDIESENQSEQNQAFFIGTDSIERFLVYHSLHHFQFLIFKHAQEEVAYRRKVGKDKSDEIILAETLQTRVWVQQHLHRLIDLLEKCSIVVSVVMRDEDDEPVAEVAEDATVPDEFDVIKPQPSSMGFLQDEKDEGEGKDLGKQQAVAIVDENGQQTVALLDATGQNVIAVLDPNDPQTLALLAGQNIDPTSLAYIQALPADGVPKQELIDTEDNQTSLAYDNDSAFPKEELITNLKTETPTIYDVYSLDGSLKEKPNAVTDNPTPIIHEGSSNDQVKQELIDTSTNAASLDESINFDVKIKLEIDHSLTESIDETKIALTDKSIKSELMDSNMNEFVDVDKGPLAAEEDKQLDHVDAS